MGVTEAYLGTNYTPGRQGERMRYIVLHTVAGNADGALATFRNPNKARSANEIICLNGERILCVREGDTSWGAANWPVNKAGYNIEHEDNGNYDDPVRTNELYASSAETIADKCRRYGIQCKLIAVDGNHMPTESTGIVLHKQVSQTGTACPDGLDVNRIVREAQAILGGASPVPPPVPAAGDPHPEYVPLNQAVTVTIQTLLVRSLPSRNGTPGVANTPDGALHAGNVITITGYTQGEDVSGNNIWLRSVWGHWFWSGGTDFQAAPAPTPQPAPAVQPANITDYTPLDGEVTVTGDGLAVRIAPERAAALNLTHTADGRLGTGTVIHISGYKHGENVDGNDVWLRSQYGNWVWSGGTNFQLPAAPTPEPAPTPAPEPAPQPTAVVLPPFVQNYEENHATVTAQRDVVAVDLMGQGPDRQVLKGQQIDQAGLFSANDHAYIRTESSAKRNAWYGIPVEVLTEVPAAPNPALDGPKAMDILKPATKPVALPTVPEPEAPPTPELFVVVGAFIAKLQDLISKLTALLPFVGRKEEK